MVSVPCHVVVIRMTRARVVRASATDTSTVVVMRCAVVSVVVCREHGS